MIHWVPGSNYNIDFRLVGLQHYMIKLQDFYEEIYMYENNYWIKYLTFRQYIKNLKILPTCNKY